MTERQRLISQFTTRLIQPIMTRYKIFFLRDEQDSSAREGLLEDLKQIRRQGVQNRDLDRIIRDASSGSRSFSTTIGNHVKSAKNPNLSASELALSQFSDLLLVDALKSFAQAKRAFPSSTYYRERAIIYVLQEKFDQALRISLKAKLIDLSLVSAVGAGEFQIAAPRCKAAYSILADRETVISAWEIFHMILFVAFATQTLEDARGAYEDATKSRESYGLEKVLEWGQHFFDRDFRVFISQFHVWRNWCRDSIYLRPVSTKLFDAIMANTIANALSPYSIVKLQEFSDELGIDLRRLTEIIRGLIREGKIAGGLDLVNGVYRTRPEVEDIINTESLLYRAESLKERMDRVKRQLTAKHNHQ
jgi:tetratricopeptide (TPR) repeat protein